MEKIKCKPQILLTAIVAGSVLWSSNGFAAVFDGICQILLA